MPKHPLSQNVQTSLTDASNSLEKAEHAVQQAMSHPATIAIKQALNALDKADRAVEVTQESQNQIAVEHLNERYEQAAENLANTQTET